MGTGRYLLHPRLSIPFLVGEPEGWTGAALTRAVGWTSSVVTLGGLEVGQVSQIRQVRLGASRGRETRSSPALHPRPDHSRPSLRMVMTVRQPMVIWSFPRRPARSGDLDGLPGKRSSQKGQVLGRRAARSPLPPPCTPPPAGRAPLFATRRPRASGPYRLLSCFLRSWLPWIMRRISSGLDGVR